MSCSSPHASCKPVCCVVVWHRPTKPQEQQIPQPSVCDVCWCLCAVAAGPKGEGGLDDATGASGAAGGASYKQTSRATQLSKCGSMQ